MSCHDEREHRRRAEDDFRYRGRYGYDQEQYDRHADYDSCRRAYTEEFDRQVREDDRRREERHTEERAEELAAERRATARRDEEEQYYPGEFEQYPEPPDPEPEPEEIPACPQPTLKP